MSWRPLIGALAVAAIVAIGGAGGGRPSAGPQETDTKSQAGETSRFAPSVSPQTYPELRGQPPQRDVSPNDPAVRAYERTHRLLLAVPITYRGVTFDRSDSVPRSHRIPIAAYPNGLDDRATRRAYAALLGRLKDPGTAYTLRVESSPNSIEELDP